MDARDLRIFEAVAQAGNMSRAAERLNTVQSNVTVRIKALEDEIGLPLFTRTNQGVSLTAAGERLLPYAQQVRALMTDAKQAARGNGAPAGRLAIGSLETTAAVRLAPLLSGFVAACPDVDLSVVTGTTAELIADVRTRRLEGAFVAGGAGHADLASAVYFEEELVLLTRPDAGSLETISRDPAPRLIVLKAGCSYRHSLEAWVRANGAADVRHLEFGTLESILSMVAAGLGITMLPLSLVDRMGAAERVAMHRLPDGEGCVETVFIRRHDSYQSSAMTAFLDVFARHASVSRREHPPSLKAISGI